jgi:hypothetical protein
MAVAAYENALYLFGGERNRESSFDHKVLIDFPGAGQKIPINNAFQRHQAAWSAEKSSSRRAVANGKPGNMLEYSTRQNRWKPALRARALSGYALTAFEGKSTCLAVGMDLNRLIMFLFRTGRCLIGRRDQTCPQPALNAGAAIAGIKCISLAASMARKRCPICSLITPGAKNGRITLGVNSLRAPRTLRNERFWLGDMLYVLEESRTKPRQKLCRLPLHAQSKLVAVLP